MATQKSKTLHYRRATWIKKRPKTNFESYIRQMSQKLTTVADKTITIDGEKYTGCAKLKKLNPTGVLLHIVTQTPGESASVVPHTAPTSVELDVGTATPPNGSEFLDGDAFLLVYGNDVCICAGGLRDGGVRQYFSELFRKARMSDNSTQFELMKVANVNIVNLINSQGVKEIDLRSTMYEATANYSRRKHKTDGALGAAGRHLKAIFGSANDTTEDSLSISLTIGLDKRRTKSISLGENRINEIAIDLANEDLYDDYVIITNTGQRISHNEIAIKTNVGIKAKGKSVDRDGAWAELMKFYLILKRSGATEQ